MSHEDCSLICLLIELPPIYPELEISLIFMRVQKQKEARQQPFTLTSRTARFSVTCDHTCYTLLLTLGAVPSDSK